jgi:multiple sugar transport system permease protein
MKLSGRYTNQRRPILRSVGFVLLVVCLCSVAFFPILWIFSTALKPPAAVMCSPPEILFTPTLNNFAEVFSKPGVARMFLNSSLVALASSLIVLLLSFPAAYSLARFRMRRKDDLAFMILSLKMFPPVAVVIPFYIMYNKLGIYDSALGLILLYVAVNIPLAVWLLIGFLKELPVALEESALVDGATPLQVLTRIVLPLSATGIAAVGILTFIMCWNEFFFALVLTGRNTRMLPVFLYTFMTFREIQWGPLMALGTLMTLPVVFLSVFFRKYLIEGITLGALKE